MEVSIVPRFLIKKISDNNIHQINWNILISTCLILLLIPFINISTLNSIPHFCLFEKIVGIPCPVCGVTRSIVSLSEFNIVESFNYNPAGILIVFSLVLQIPLRIIALINENYFKIIQKISEIMLFIVIFSLFLQWFLKLISNLNL
jgi:hypothetical protein